MSKVYTQYFQKSKVFLYPLLRIKKGVPFVPVDTFIYWEGLYDYSDRKLICVYEAASTNKFLSFVETTIKKHSFYDCCFSLDDDKHVFVFKLDKFKEDFNWFVDGKYSKFSLASKITISDFFGDRGKIAQYIKSFLSPKNYHEAYAEELDISINIIEDVYEVCSKPNIEKETFKHKIPTEINLITNNCISLEN